MKLHLLINTAIRANSLAAFITSLISLLVCISSVVIWFVSAPFVNDHMEGLISRAILPSGIVMIASLPWITFATFVGDRWYKEDKDEDEDLYNPN